MSTLPTPLSASLDALPNSIVAASILPFVTSTDWLNFRLASRACYKICHGHDVGKSNSQQREEDEESKALWCLALVRDYRFEVGNDELSMYKSIRCNPDPDDEINPFLSTTDVFIASTAFISWKHWRKIDNCLHTDGNGQKFVVAPSARLVGPYFLRAASLWRKIEQWCSDERLSEDVGPAIQSSLQPGVPFGFPMVERGYQDGKLSAFKAVYSFYSGQPSLYGSPLFEGVFPALFGCYRVYDIFSLNFWCTPRIAETGSNVLVAKDVNGMKVTTFDYRSGDVEIQSSTNKTKAVRNGCNDDQILRWFENHADQLKTYSLGHLGSDNLRVKAILRYPNLNDPTNCSRAVTRGIEVLASSIYVPEIGEMFVYSIRIRLLKQEDGEDYMSPEERGFDSCQLVSRYWRITQGGEVAEVRGEGVVGSYPLLREGGYQNFVSEDGGRTFQEAEGSHGENEYFSYQSCTGAIGGEGEMEGYLQFKAGSIQLAAGEVFDVRVAPFPLKEPQDYMY